jgi:DNA-directed RNA polymerase specialized sigma24 family protein
VKDGEFEPDEDAAVVLASCLHHAFCEKLKRRRRTERPLLTDPPAGGLSPEGALIASERDEEGEILDQIEKRVFEDCLREMRAYFSTKSQFAVLLALLRNVYQVEPLTIEQIAERTGMSTRTVDRLSHRFRVLWPEKVEKARNELAWYVTRSREDT